MKTEKEIRITKQRKIILDELRRMKSHPTADELYEVVRKRLPRISLGTVYRNLNFLSQKGTIKKLEVVGKRKRFDGDTKEHAHIRCIVCGRIVDLPGIQHLRSITKEITRKTGFEVFSNEAEFLGICPDCRKKTSEKYRKSGGAEGRMKSLKGKKRRSIPRMSPDLTADEYVKSRSFSKRLFENLERLYEDYNDREFVEPDPLQFLYHFKSVADREVAGIIASSLAFGNIKQIVRSVGRAVDIVSQSHTMSPVEFVTMVKKRDLEHAFKGFKHRWVDGKSMTNLILNTGRLIRECGSLEGCFEESIRKNGRDLVRAMYHFIERMNNGKSCGCGRLIPLRESKSACKRLNLFLRWMVRKDKVDPGGWKALKPSELISPVDTHIHRIARSIGFTERKVADLKTALEVTEAFRRISPNDPVKYDFALTRFGIKGDLSDDDLLRRLIY